MPGNPVNFAISRNFERRRELFIQVKAPVEAARHLIGTHTWAQQQERNNGETGKRQNAEPIIAQRPAKQKVQPDTDTPDCQAEPGGPNEPAHPTARPAITGNPNQLLL
jgi:hypothetical protein